MTLLPDPRRAHPPGVGRLLLALAFLGMVAVALLPRPALGPPPCVPGITR